MNIEFILYAVSLISGRNKIPFSSLELYLRNVLCYVDYFPPIRIVSSGYPCNCLIENNMIHNKLNIPASSIKSAIPRDIKFTRFLKHESHPLFIHLEPLYNYENILRYNYRPLLSQHYLLPGMGW